MAEFRKAPDNQPTSSIEHMLRNAKREYAEWERSLKNHQEGVERAEEMVNLWDDRERELEWQLEQRKEQEVNGL